MASQKVEQYYRFCPHCGRENPTVGAIPFRCQGCGYADYFGPVASVGALIVNANHELLLVRRARDPGRGKWGLPGGFVDRDETMEQAVARETMEETQLQIVDQRYLMTSPNLYDYRGILIPVIDLFFICRVASCDHLVLADGELDHFIWVRPTATQLGNMAFDSNRLAIEAWLGELGH